MKRMAERPAVKQVLGIAHRAGLAQDFAEFLRPQSRKQRQMGDQRVVDCGHIGSVAATFGEG